MKLRPLVFDNDSLLRQRSLAVNVPLSAEDASTIEYMLAYIKMSRNDELAQKYNLRPGVGMSAIQIGVAKQLVVINYLLDNIEKTFLMINPKIVSRSTRLAFLEGGEGCLSVKDDIPGFVYRSQRVTVKYISYPDYNEKTITLSNYEAIVFQHEIDHLNGVLYYDHIDSDNPEKLVDGAIAV